MSVFSVVSLPVKKSIAVFNNFGTPNLFCPCFILKKSTHGFYGRVSALSIDEKITVVPYQTRLHTHIHKRSFPNTTNFDKNTRTRKSK
ncbi:hypothetical protein CW298_4462 [Salmonella enterica subsp. enterica serovar Muenchen]|nr:hypothetical protein CW298_4462 [Salmonella enterica subsp. enterica serovar Muenchen]CEH20777.1 hypothetical protein SMA01_0986 [Salmonella enterica subsp. enterica serovar Manhattan str. 111113]